MFSQHPQHFCTAALIFVCLTLLSSPAQSEIIEGYRDLKFGMTESEVQALENCSTASECLYELGGKNRYLHPLYLQTKSQDAPPTLVRISIDMGRFTDAWYGELQFRLQDQYRLTHDITENDIAAFENEQVSELTSGYENGQVLLKVVRRKFGNLILKVIYQNKDLASESIKHLNSSH